MTVSLHPTADMYTSTTPRICNIKAHFKLTKKFEPRQANSSPRFMFLMKHTIQKVNFTLYRDPSYKRIVFTLFHHSPHVNITGARSYTALELAVKRFSQTVGEEIRTENIIIDNTTAVGRVWTHTRAHLDIHALKKTISIDETNKSSLSIRSDFFPGAVLRRKEFASIIIFSSGKFVIVGGKTPWHIQEAYQRLLALIRQLR